MKGCRERKIKGNGITVAVQCICAVYREKEAARRLVRHVYIARSCLVAVGYLMASLVVSCQRRSSSMSGCLIQ